VKNGFHTVFFCRIKWVFFSFWIVFYLCFLIKLGNWKCTVLSNVFIMSCIAGPASLQGIQKPTQFWMIHWIGMNFESTSYIFCGYQIIVVVHSQLECQFPFSIVPILICGSNFKSTCAVPNETHLKNIPGTRTLAECQKALRVGIINSHAEFIILSSHSKLNPLTWNLLIHPY